MVSEVGLLRDGRDIVAGSPVVPKCLQHLLSHQSGRDLRPLLNGSCYARSDGFNRVEIES